MIWLLFIIIMISSVLTNCKKDRNAPYNVLFIAVDDLRPELNCYGKSQIISPNIDRIAEQGLIFTRAYCNIPVCGASRASLLTGTRPTRNSFLHYYTWIDKERDHVPTLPEHFRLNGYYTVSLGKITHHEGDAKGSWNEEWRYKPPYSWRDYILEENNIKDTAKGSNGPPYECIELHDTIYKDGKTALKAIEYLNQLKIKEQPFFLAVGFCKPHLPFNAPKKYWDLYDKENIRLPYNNFIPENAPEASIHQSEELRGYGLIPPEGALEDTLARDLIHGYYACVSYTDALIGQVLDELKRLDLDQNTIVVLWSDHGWNLREHTMWCKHCNYETSLRSPLMITVPGMEGNKKNESIVEFIDIYPTLCDLCHISLPAHLEGESLLPLLNNPDSIKDDYAVCKYFDGVTYIEQNYFYTEFIDSSTNRYARMLYDHGVDPDENINISEDEVNKSLVSDLSKKLRDNWGKDF